MKKEYAGKNAMRYFGHLYFVVLKITTNDKLKKNHSKKCFEIIAQCTFQEFGF